TCRRRGEDEGSWTVQAPGRRSVNRESSAMSSVVFPIGPDNEELPEEVQKLAELVHGQHGEPVVVIPSEHLQAVAEVLGGYAISSPIPNLDGNQPFQFDAPLTFFYGIASPTAREVPHRHPLQDEWYHPEGEMEVEAWWNSHRRTVVASP